MKIKFTTKIKSIEDQDNNKTKVVSTITKKITMSNPIDPLISWPGSQILKIGEKTQVLSLDEIKLQNGSDFKAFKQSSKRDITEDKIKEKFILQYCEETLKNDLRKYNRR